MQDNNQNERVRPRLESASELKGKKAVSKNSASIAKKRLMTIISLVLVLAITVGAYFITDAMRPVEETDPSSTETESSLLYLVEGRNKTDMAKMTIYHDGVPQYTILSNLSEKAALQAAAPEGEVVETGLQDYEIDGMPQFTTSYDAINSMVTYSFSVVSSKAVEIGCEDLSVYGLDKPAIDVVYTYHDGTEMVMSIGDTVPIGNYYYMNLNHSADVYMVYYTVYDYFARPVEQLHAERRLGLLDDAPCLAVGHLHVLGGRVQRTELAHAQAQVGDAAPELRVAVGRLAFHGEPDNGLQSGGFLAFGHSILAFNTANYNNPQIILNMDNRACCSFRSRYVPQGRTGTGDCNSPINGDCEGERERALPEEFPHGVADGVGVSVDDLGEPDR